MSSLFKHLHPAFAEPLVRPSVPIEIDYDTAPAGLKFLCLPGDKEYTDLVSGEVGVVSGVLTQETDEHGPAAVAVANDFITFTNVHHGIGTGPLTLWVLYKWPGGGASWQTVISLPNNNDFGIYLPRSSTNKYMSHDCNPGGTRHMTNLVVAEDEILSASLVSFGSSAGSNMVGNLNGMSQETADQVYAEGGTTGVMLLNGQGTEDATGRMYAAAVFNRALSAEEQQSLAHEPYKTLLKPSVRYFAFPSIGVVTASVTCTQTEASESQSLAVGNIIKAVSTQTELDGSQAVNISIPVNINSSQNEITETQVTSLSTLIELISLQTELSESQAVSIVGVVTAAITAAQTELSDVQVATMDTIVTVAPAQTELSESQTSSVTGGGINITATQNEASESQVFLIQGIIEILATQTEESESQSSAIEGLVNFTASQTEFPEQQSATISSIITSLISAAQVESSELQTLVVEGVLGISANQQELSDVQAASLKGIIAATISQLEQGEINTVLINSVATLQAVQSEASETQLASLLELIIYQALNELTVKLAPELVAKLEQEFTVVLNDDVEISITPDS